MRKILESWKEYGTEVIMPSFRWIKRHTLGYVLFNVLIGGAVVYFCKQKLS